MYYPSKESVSIFTTAGVPLSGEPIICTYIDLERLIDECRFSSREKQILDDLMYGYTPSDIGEMRGIARQSVEQFLKRAVSKIVKRNNARWKEVYGQDGDSEKEN